MSIASIVTNAAKNVADLEQRVAKLEENLKQAFPKNDLGQPDFDGHRKDHVRRIEESEQMRGYKEDVTKRVLGVIVMGLVGLILLGLVEYMKVSIK